MTDPTMHLLDYLSKFGLAIDSDFLREGLRVLIQSVIEAEVTQRVGAQPYERSPERTNQRNGYRERPYATRVGELDLHIAKLREGTYFPCFLEPRRLLEKMGLNRIDKSEVSRICKALDEPVRAFRERALEGEYPYLWVDAAYLKMRQNLRHGMPTGGVRGCGGGHRGAGERGAGERGAGDPGLCGGGQ